MRLLRRITALLATLGVAAAVWIVAAPSASAACTQGPGCDSGWHTGKTYWSNTVCSNATNNAYVQTNLDVKWLTNDDRHVNYSGSEECVNGVAWGNLTRVVIKSNANCGGCTLTTIIDDRSPPARGSYRTYSYHPAYPRNQHTYTMYGYFGTHLGYITVFN